MPKQVIQSFAVGDLVVIDDGTLYADDHPLVKKYPAHFEDIRVLQADGTIEQATAAPGEKRSVTRKP